MAATKTGTCFYCSNPVSEMGGFTKMGLNKIAHNNCYADKQVEEKLAEQERVLTESFIRKERESAEREAALLKQVNDLRSAKGQSAVALTGSTMVDTAKWDEQAVEVCKLAMANIGPAIPLGTLRRYAWFIYTKLRDRGLLQPISDDVDLSKVKPDPMPIKFDDWFKKE